MKYLFFGTPDFAAIILEKLVKAGLPPSFVVCNPDRPVGRKHIITPPPTKSLILNHESWNIKILQPEKLTESFKFQVSSFKPDFFIVAAYAKIIPKEILKLPRLGTIGVHPSLLPKYRGSSPIQSVILNGDSETGVSLFLVDEKVDHGGIVSSIKYQVSSNDNYETLNKKLAELGADLLIRFLGSPTSQKLINNIKEVGLPDIELQPQDESKATYTKKFITEDGYVEPKDLEKAEHEGGEIAVEIDRKIRALNPEPGVYTFQDGKRMKILEAELTPENKLKLKKIQFEGGKPQIIS